MAADGAAQGYVSGGVRDEPEALNGSKLGLFGAAWRAVRAAAVPELWLGGIVNAARIRLHHVLFLAFTLISVVPVVFLTIYVQRTALDKEFAAVEDKHLLLARNLTGALSRYVADVESAFTVAALSLGHDHPSIGFKELLSSLHLKHVCLIDAQGRVEKAITGGSVEVPNFFPPAMIDRLRPTMRQAAKAPGEVVFSDVLADASGAPTIFLLTSFGDGRFALGALGTEYFTEVQKRITFGERGHAAIVDARGRLLAHPNPKWRLAMKDISKVKPVAAMMQGLTGVTTFYSPAVEKDMIAGFTTVPRTGWGAMIPQPVDELRQRAKDFQTIAIAIAGLGILTAGFISWWLAGLLARPIQAVVDSARKLAAGDPTARVADMAGATPSELRELAQSFNHMATEVGRNFELQNTALKAKAASAAKSQFLAHMSHELRTPLNAVIGFAEVIKGQLLGPIDNARYLEYARDIHISGMHLLDMINDILDLSMVEAGKLAIESDWIDAGRPVKDCVRIMQPAADAAKVRLAVEIEPDLAPIYSDEGRLRQILLNLLSNSIKFTAADGEIELKLGRAIDGNGVRIVLRDTGVGIRPEDLPLTLRPFGQVGSAMTRHHYGTGLGLPLARKLVDLLGGSFDLRSQVGVGTVVDMTFPTRLPPGTEIVS